MVMQLYYQMRKVVPVTETRYVPFTIKKYHSRPDKVVDVIPIVIPLGGVFEEVGDINETVGGGYQKVGSSNQ